MKITTQDLILIVDDQPPNLKVLFNFLQESGFKVLVAEDGESAIEKLQVVVPALILLDVMMPGIDGFETCRRLKTMAATQEIPVIFMTVLDEPVDKVKGLSLGAVDYITKPFQQEEVLARVRLHLRLHKLTKTLEAQNLLLHQEVVARTEAEAQLQQLTRELEKRVAEQTSVLHSILNSMADGVVVANEQGNLTLFNRSAEQILGRDFQQVSLDEFIQQSGIYLPDRITPYPAQEMALAKAIRGEEIDEEVAFVCHPQKPAGTLISSNARPIRDEQGTLRGGVVVFRDITERDRAETALKQQAEREKLMGAIAHRIRRSLNLHEILNTTVAEVRAFLQTNRVLIYQFQPDWNGVVLVESVDSQCGSILGTVIQEPYFAETYIALYQQGRIQAIEDINTAGFPPNYVDLLSQFQVKASLVLPIVQGEKLWGLLIAHHCIAPREWQPLEIKLLQELATQLAIAIQQSELYAQVQAFNTDLEHQVQERTVVLQQYVKVMAAIQQITNKVRDHLDERQIFQTAVQQITESLQASYGYAALYNRDRTTATITYEYSQNPLGSALGQVIPIQNPDEFEPTNTLDYAVYPVLAQPMTVGLLAPIFDDYYSIGYLAIFHQNPYHFTEPEMKIVQQVANQCAIATRQARLYKAAQNQVEELEKLNNLKDDFLSTVSHELRAPMSSIKMAAQMLKISLTQQGMLNLGQNKAARYFQILQDECEREISLINDLLDLSRLEAGTQPLILTTIELSNWLPTLVEPFIERTQSQQQHLQIHFPTDLPQLITDKAEIERILTELLNNACKYTPAGETITITAHLSLEGLQMSVSNSGVYLPASELSRIFEKFYRIPNSDPWKHGGTGLGLALVKKLVEHLGANIQVESTREQTTFTLKFPLTSIKVENSAIA